MGHMVQTTEDLRNLQLKDLIHQLMCLCDLNWESYDSNWCLRNIDQFILYCVTVLELIENICYTRELNASTNR